MGTSIRYLADNEANTLQPEVIPLAREMLDLGSGEHNLWDELDIRLEKVVEERQLIRDNQQTLNDLLAEVDTLVADVMGNADTSMSSSAGVILTGRIALLCLAAVGLLGILLGFGYFAFIRTSTTAGGG